MKTKTYDHIIKRIKKCTGLSNDDCCVKQLKKRTLPPPHTHIHTHTRTPQKKKKEEHKKTKETRMPILLTKMISSFFKQPECI